MNTISFSLLISLIANLAFCSLYVSSRVFLDLDPNFLLIAETSCIYYAISTSIILILHKKEFSNFSKVILTLAALFIPYLGLIIPNSTRVLFDITGFFSFCYVLYSSLKACKNNIKICLAFFILFLSYAIWANSYFSSWTGIFAPIFGMELAEIGLLHKDLFYMSSMISMIKHHSIVSTGIHGLVENQIHYLPLYWHTAISKTLNTSSILSLCTNAYLILSPLLLVVFLTSCKIKHELTTKSVLIIAGLIIFLDSLVFFPVTINYDFAYSLIIFSICLLFINDARNIRKINYFEVIISLLIIALLFKIKPHTAVFIFLIYISSYLNSFKKYPYKFLAIAFSLVLAVIFILPKESIYYKYISGFHPFSLNIIYPETAIFFIFVSINLVLLFLAKQETEYKNKLIILSHLFLFVVSFIAIRGIPDGNSHYFTYCLVLLSIFYTYDNEIFFKIFSQKIDKYKNFILIIFIFSNLCLSYRSILSILEYKKIILQNNNIQSRSDILEIKQTLNSIDSTNSFIYVEPEQNRIWNLVKECSSKAFLFPAYFEIPRILGAPPASFCALYKSGYGYSAYTNAKSVKLSKQELCEYSRNFNINKILILRFDKSVEIEKHTCDL